MMTITVRDAESERDFGSISDSDAGLLRERLESDAAGADRFFIDLATVDLLRQASASSTLLGALTAAIADSGERVVTLVHDAESESPPDAEPTTITSTARERDLTCVVCGHRHFTHRKAQLHTALASFFDVEWLGSTADCYVCDECGYIHWFLR